MMLDASLAFDPSGTAITTTANSTNSYDAGVGRDLATGAKRLRVLVLCGNTFAAASSTATLNVQLQGAPDAGGGTAGTFTTLVESGPLGLGQLAANTKICQFDLASNSETGILLPVTTTATWSSAATTITVASATGLALGQYVTPALGPAAGIVPGTYITGISGNTITISTATTAAAGLGTVVTFGVTLAQMPRFYQLRYVVSSGPFTAGKLGSFILLDADEQIIFAPGFTVPN